MYDSDRSAPLYERVRRAILAEIEGGIRPAGSYLPAEPELCAAYGVSRVTLRRAISELCAEGRLIRQQGRGTLVAPRKLPQTLVSLSGFSEIMDGLGRSARHRVLARDDRPDAPDVATKLQAATLIRFDRLLEAEGRPITLEALWFDADRFAVVIEPVAQGGSFYAALRHHAGIGPATAERQIDIGFPTRDQCRVLDTTQAQPVYRIEKTVFGPDDAPLAHSRLTTPCHLVTFTLRN